MVPLMVSASCPALIGDLGDSYPSKSSVSSVGFEEHDGKSNSREDKASEISNHQVRARKVTEKFNRMKMK